MPIHLPALSRRQFLVAAGASLVALPTVVRARELEPDVVYLLNDTHIGENHPADSPVPSHLRQVVQELVDREQQPACVLINGDLALRDGQPGDYTHLAKLLAPLHEAEIDVHLTLGNHDNRETFYKVMSEQRPEQPVVESRHISIVQTPHANFFLLDSLQKTMVTQGTLGPEQLGWLASALDAHTDRAAIIVSHHNPRLGGDPVHFPGGLIDSRALWDVLTPRKQVKAYVHGHIHDRTYAEQEGIHIINLPATSYVGNPRQSTTGWTIARLSEGGIQLTTRTTEEDHPWNNETRKMPWLR